MELFSYLISAVCISTSIMYIYYLNQNKPFKLTAELVFVYLFAIFVFAVTYKYAPPFMRQIVIMMLLLLMSFVGYGTSIKDSILNMMYLELICIFAEMLYGTFFFLFNTANVMEWNHSIIGMILSNTVIPIIMIIIAKLRISKKIYNKLNLFVEYLSKYQIFIVILLFLVSLNTIFNVIYYEYYSNRLIVFITINLVFIFYTLVLFLILYTSNKYAKIKDKYTISLENLKMYENMLDQYRISNHENKNQLLLIRNMVDDKKTKNYIDELIDNKEKDDSNVYNRLKRIPSSSMRAVIYSKVLLMQNKKINYSLTIDRKLTSKDFADISNTLSLDICSILSIFIDNAIDEAANSSKKQILMEFIKNGNNIEIAISNTCENEVKLDEIYKMGYSTKGAEHGYGLSMVKTILDSRLSRLSNKFEKVNDIFTQYLYIKIK